VLLVGCSQPKLDWPGVHSIRVPANHDLHEPSWSPDGRLIAVAADTAMGRPSGELVIVNLGDESSLRLDKGCPFQEPHWSPDGAMFLYDGCDDISVTAYPDLTLVATVPGEHAEWSPDGTQFVISEGLATGIRRPSSVYVADQYGNPTTVLFSNDRDERFAFGGLAWSRSAERIAFSFGSVPGKSTAPLQRDIYVVAPDGTGLTTIGKTQADEFDPSWSPDGQWLVYISATKYSPAAVGTITFAKADGSCIVPALSSERLSGVDWSPDGDQLAVTYRNQLYILDIATTFGEAFTHLDTLCASPGHP
jgi:Tol biopolymer transport system component